MSDEPCSKCSLRVPINGFICEWCTMEELQRIRGLPVAEVRAALAKHDLEKYGYVRPAMSPMDQFKEATKKMQKLKEDWRKLGADIPDE